MELLEAKESLKKLQEKIAAFNHAQESIYYDSVTSAPKGTTENRAITLGVLSEESYKIITSEETYKLLEYLEEKKDELTPEENRQVFLLFKDLKNSRKIPMEEYVEYSQLLTTAESVWHDAKLNSDFSAFEPYLEKIFNTNIKFAKYIAPDKDPYDYWLGEYETGLTKETCDKFFDTLRSRLVPLIKKIQSVPQIDDSFLHGNFPAASQDQLTKYLMPLLGLDMDHITYATTEHPFTISLGSHLDERITTHYYEDYFASSMYSIIHESGHALYDMGSKNEYAFTVIDGGVSMGIHESQSRFYENILGRSREFITFIYPKLCELFPQIQKQSPEDIYKAINKAQPSLIRTEADEVTYSLHVMVRYEIEKKVMAGELKVHDIPKEWNKLYKEYLGVDVPDDKHGCLQDSHWSGGSIGYFPSYALGSAYGAQFLAKMSETINVSVQLEKGDFTKINEWNKENIWQHGSLYTPKELLDRVLERDFDPNYYLDYLENKMKDIYNI